MAEIRLTAADDVYTQADTEKDAFNTVYGEDGNDVIRLFQGTAVGGKGNDVFERIVDPNNLNRKMDVAYWTSPLGIEVNLTEGWALDGFGGRDTLIGIWKVHGSGKDDKFTGDSAANFFHPNGGKDYLDGRGGYDGLDVREIPPNADGSGIWKPALLNELDVAVSPDGRNATITVIRYPKIQYTLLDMEYFQLMNDTTTYLLADFIKPQDVAEQTIAAGGNLRWNASGAVGKAVGLSFSFVTKAPADGIGAPGFRALSAGEQQAVRDILGKTAALCGLTFTEVVESGSAVGQLRFGVSSQAATKGASWMPNQPGAGDLAGDVWMDSDSMLGLAPGTEGYMALLHEIGHALGLRHPRNVDAGDAWAMQMRSQDDRSAFTVMSENLSADGLFRAEWGGLDVLALRYLYGTVATNTGPTVYALGAREAGQQTTLVDDGGLDTLDASALTAGVTLDLTPGHLSSAGQAALGLVGVDNIAITAGSWIENAVGSAFDDVLVGNDLENRLTGGLGNDWIDGGKGIDTAVFASQRADYELSNSYGKVYLKARDGVSGFDTLVNMERLQFADQLLVLAPTGLANDVLLTVDEDVVLNSLLPAPDDLARSAVNYKLVGAPAHGVATLSAQGQLVFTPVANYNGPDRVVFDITSATGVNRYLGFINVLPVNDGAPVGKSAEYLVQYGALFSATLPAATDADNDPLSYLTITDPANGVAVLMPNGSFTYQAKANFVGIDSFNFAISDGAGGSTAYSAKFTVALVNQSLRGTAGADNLPGASSGDGYSLLAGNDRVTGGGANDVIDGGDGLDTAIYLGKRANYTVVAAGYGWTVLDKVGDEGTDKLMAVERLHFTDREVALDMAKDAVGGQAAQIIRALFGSATLKVPEFTGYAVVLQDQGMSYPDLVALAVRTDAFWTLAGDKAGHSNTAFVNFLYKNVLGVKAPADELKYFVDLLESGTLTQSSLGLLACKTPLNSESAELVGLAALGLDYFVPAELG